MTTTRKPTLTPEEQERARWEASAARQNERVASRAPLFAHAGLVPTTSAEEQRRKVTEHWQRFEADRAESDARNYAKGAERRAWVTERVHPDELRELDRRATWMPKSGAYCADFWGDEVRKRDPETWRSMQSPTWRATMDAVAAAEAARPAPAPAPEQLGLTAPARIATVNAPALRVAPVDDQATDDAAEREEQATTEATGPNYAARRLTG